MRSCHGVFTDQFIFKTVLARIWNIFQIPQTRQQNLQTYKWYSLPFNNVYFSFLISYTSNALIHMEEILFSQENEP